MDLLLGAIVAIIVIAVASWVIWRKRRMSMFKRFGIPGPEPSFWLGNLQDISRNENMEKYLVEKYGKLVGFYIGPRPFMIVADPEILKIVQVKEFKNFTNKDLLFPDLGVSHKYLTKSLEVANDDEWKRGRNCLNPAFTTGKIKNMLKTINEAVELFVKKAEESKEEPLDIMDMCKRLSFDTICRTSFEVATNVQNNEKNIFTDSVEYVFNFGANNILDVIGMCFPEFEPIPMHLRRFKDSLRCFFNLPSCGNIVKICQGIIDSKKKSMQTNEKIQPVNLLQLMLTANLDESDKDGETEAKSSSTVITDEFILGNSVLFMLGGYESIGSTLGYTLYLLAANSGIQDKVRDEINKCLDGKDDVEYSDLASLEYLDEVLAEVSRLYPFYFPGVNRICSEEFKYKDIVIPKNCRVTVPLWYLHRHPDYWASPEEFIPERFSSENRAKVDHFVYQPFGAGPRICIGMRLAQLVMKTALVHLLKSYRVEKVNDQEIEPCFRIFFIRPMKTLYVRMIPL